MSNDHTEPSQTRRRQCLYQKCTLKSVTVEYGLRFCSTHARNAEKVLSPRGTFTLDVMPPERPTPATPPRRRKLPAEIKELKDILERLPAMAI